MGSYVIKGFISTPENEFQAPYLVEFRDSVFTGKVYSFIYVNNPSIDPESIRPIIAEQLRNGEPGQAHSGLEAVDESKIEKGILNTSNGDCFFMRVGGMIFVSNPKAATPATVERLYERNRDAIEGRKRCWGPKETVAFFRGFSERKLQSVGAHKGIAAEGAIADQKIPQKQ